MGASRVSAVGVSVHHLSRLCDPVSGRCGHGDRGVQVRRTGAADEAVGDGCLRRGRGSDFRHDRGFYAGGFKSAKAAAAQRPDGGDADPVDLYGALLYVGPDVFAFLQAAEGQPAALRGSAGERPELEGVAAFRADLYPESLRRIRPGRAPGILHFGKNAASGLTSTSRSRKAAGGVSRTACWALRRRSRGCWVWTGC